ncbi:MAG: M20/M25/M40 family metallo-hydrolase [Solidesulfovibrio sp.]|uniref:M20/M25/M40 family metallo-hydrolase n=1 Tax=Solidesulfovibrio sp. TaxID=2910990 RepID=UPI00315819E7
MPALPKPVPAWPGLARLLLLALLLAAPQPARAEAVTDAVDKAAPACRDIADAIFALKEQSGKEFQSSALLKTELARLGFTVTGDLAVPADLVPGGVSRTAFKAEMAGNGNGPTVCLMLEYDALANGHSCGHNLIAGAGLLAAAALAQRMPQTPGRLVVMGTPDEERGSAGGGKVALLEGGHFNGIDVVLASHPADRFSLDQRLLAMKRATFTFTGKAAHAAAAPQSGINALDAALLTFHCVDMLRQHVRQDVRMHGIITKGGDKVNVVPELAQAEFGVRALDTATMEDAYGRVCACARAGALGTGAGLECTEPRVSIAAPVRVAPLIDRMRDALHQAGIDDAHIRDFDEFVSSDLGAVGDAHPTVNVWFKIAPDGTALHADAMREAAGSAAGWQAAVATAKAMALTADGLLRHPDAVQEIRQAFDAAKAGH